MLAGITGAGARWSSTLSRHHGREFLPLESVGVSATTGCAGKTRRAIRDGSRSTGCSPRSTIAIGVRCSSARRATSAWAGPQWLREIAAELWSANDAGIPLEGVCLFPIIDRMDWNDENHWHNSGLWDLVEQPDGVSNGCSITSTRRSFATARRCWHAAVGARHHYRKMYALYR